MAYFVKKVAKMAQSDHTGCVIGLWGLQVRNYSWCQEVDDGVSKGRNARRKFWQFMFENAKENWNLLKIVPILAYILKCSTIYVRKWRVLKSSKNCSNSCLYLELFDNEFENARNVRKLTKRVQQFAWRCHKYTEICQKFVGISSYILKWYVRKCQKHPLKMCSNFPFHQFYKWLSYATNILKVTHHFVLISPYILKCSNVSVRKL